MVARKKIEPSRMRASIGQIVDNLRERLGLNQAELGRRTSIDATSISRMLKGDYTFADYHLEALATALEVTPAQLLPDGPQPDEVPVLEAIRAGEPGPALHALAVALGITGRQLVAAAGFGGAPSDERPDRSMASVGWAAATLTRQIAEAVSPSHEEAVELAARWMTWGDAPPPEPPRRMARLVLSTRDPGSTPIYPNPAEDGQGDRED